MLHDWRINTNENWRMEMSNDIEDIGASLMLGLFKGMIMLMFLPIIFLIKMFFGEKNSNG